MYVGRIVSVGRNKDNKLVAMYRVSSRSFPNRQAKNLNGSVAILPKEGYELDVFKNVYISYNCLRLVNNCYAIVCNGSHTDPIAEKLESGMNVRDALISVLFGMDYEHDDYNTPRIAAVIDKNSNVGYLGTVKANGIAVQEMTLKKGEAFYLATYEHSLPSKEYCDDTFDVSSAEDACDYILGKGVFADLERPITAVVAIETTEGFNVAFKDAT